MFLFCRFGKPVKGTYILADVTAKDPVTKVSFNLLWDLSPVFDRLIGDASGDFELVRRIQGSRRTSVDTFVTTSATICFRFVRIKIQVGKNYPNMIK